jgi:integrase
MRLYSKQANRLYLNKKERLSFEIIADVQAADARMLCLVLLYTGCRLQEALNLRRPDIQLDEGCIAINSLKKRNKHHVRQVPVPEHILDDLYYYCSNITGNKKLFSFCRTTAWMRVKSVMTIAEIKGQHATPKGLRHSFGVHCAFSNVTMPLAQKWMGHADIKTTAIYYQIVGKEELQMAKRMWVDTRD